MTNADKLQAVINTLEAIMIPATYDNVSRITGILKTLAEIRDEMTKPEEAGTDG